MTPNKRDKRKKNQTKTHTKPPEFESTQTVKQSFLKLWMQTYNISMISHLKNLFVCGWRSRRHRKISVSRNFHTSMDKAFYNYQLFGIGFKTFQSTVAFQWIKCTRDEIRTLSSVTSLCFFLVSSGCYSKFTLSVSVRFWFSLPLNARILAFLCLCKALWVALWLNSASQFPAWSALESIHQFSNLCFSAHTARAWLTWRDAGRRQEQKKTRANQT